MKRYILPLLFSVCVAAAQDEVPGRPAPTMTAERAIELARKAIQQKGTRLNKRFLAEVKWMHYPHPMMTEEMRKFADGKHWLITYEDPEFPSDTRVAGIRILVFVYPNNHVAIISPP